MSQIGSYLWNYPNIERLWYIYCHIVKFLCNIHGDFPKKERQMYMSIYCIIKPEKCHGFYISQTFLHCNVSWCRLEMEFTLQWFSGYA